MKQYLLRNVRQWVTLLLLVYGGVAMGQPDPAEVKVNNTVVTNFKNPIWDSPSFKSEPGIRSIVSPNTKPSSEKDAAKSTASGQQLGDINVWLEHGDGGFTTQAVSKREPVGRVKYPIFLRAMALYDTSKGKDGMLTRSMLGDRLNRTDRVLRSSDNDTVGLLAAGRNITMTASNGILVQGEPHNLAITYKLPQFNNNTGDTYVAVLCYDNTAFFETLQPEESNSFAYSKNPAETIPNVRYFDGQKFSQIPNGYNLINRPKGSTADFAMGLNQGDNLEGGERNFFVTLHTKKDLSGLDVGATTIITVVLLRVSNGEVSEVDRYSMTYQFRLTAFDPNHLTQSPACLLLPKKAQPLSYRIQFQNLGQGPADTVRIIFKRPAALANAAYALQSFNFGGKTLPADAALFTFTHSYNNDQHEDTFLLAPKWAGGSPLHVLRGSHKLPDPLTNPATMGEINFTLMAPANTGDEIEARAYIYFHSQFAADPAVPNGQWEKVVPTNTAKSVYKEKDCQCNETCPDGGHCYPLFGLCWWWWVLILLGLLLLLWLLRRRR